MVFLGLHLGSLVTVSLCSSLDYVFNNKVTGKFNEGDASATRNDFYLGGDNISFQPDLFKQMHQQALARGNGTYNVDVIKEHFKNRYAASKAANAQFYFNPPSALVVMGAYYFIPAFFSNGTMGAGGVANEASITSFYGALPDRPNAWDDPELTYTHVPERIPTGGWYRRGTPLTLVETALGILDILLYAQPALGGAGADQSWVLGPLSIPDNPQALSCFLYNAVYANFPSSLYNLILPLQVVINAVSNLIVPGYSAIGCKVQYPDALGSFGTWPQFFGKYMGEARNHAVGSGWYVGY
jgi:Peroxidase, family 2